MRSFQEDAKELIVRICRFPKQVPSPSESDHGMIRVGARFDEAVDTESGERLGKGKDNRLEWTCRKKLFGDPFGHIMKTGSLYYVRVHRKAAGNPDHAVRYYVDDVLEKEVKDRRLDPILSFLDFFEEEDKEMLFLNRQPVSGRGVFRGYKRICLISGLYGSA